MKPEDFLSQASRELRDQGEPLPSEVAATRARIMTSMRVSARRSRRAMYWTLPIAAVLAASTALATNATEVRRIWHRLVGIEPSVTQVAAPVATAPVATAPVVASPTVAAPTESPPDESSPAPNALPLEPAPPPPMLAHEAREKVESAPRSRASKSASRPATESVDTPSTNTAPPEPTAESESAPLELYKKAHRLHFQQQKYGEALAAWNDYLRSEPNGSLAVEARYNRALALLRLGRRDEARRALAPFARGEVGSGYRADEARSLLDALEGRDP